MLLAQSRSAVLQTPIMGLEGEEGQTIQLESLAIPNADQNVQVLDQLVGE